ncbi:MAG TPA: 4Fe-4S dicluster domain-containing protein [Candidatus Polarisedimenticolaceae bacterium]|nr:4Fe-4S dicluster domain-containing protein [Candidatus Polarisedimenticolaceae bacterium]
MRVATEPVLPTMNVDGTRRWLVPRLSPGKFWRRRRWVAWGLLALFTLLPYLRVAGKPAILLDLAHRRFTLLGTTFLPTDTILLALLLLGIFVSIFLLTALAGRVWCGWACPQTVYLEFVYRPLERAVGRNRLLQSLVFLAVSVFLAHTFLAYFVGIEALTRWVRQSPLQHPAPFLVMATTTALMFLDFGWFREQVCLLACPYGRFQSALLDRHSLIVGYDARRGEPRGSLKDAGAGDCIDCGACVRTCPTGIDIRSGLQMECVHCTQCIDACDAIMDRVGRPRGLVRYGSSAEFAGEPKRLLRPRVLIYPAIVVVAWGLLGLQLAGRAPAEVTVLRGLGVPFLVRPDGMIQGAIRVKVVHRGEGERTYRVELLDGESPAASLRLLASEPLVLAPGATGTAAVFALAPGDAFGSDGKRDVRLRISDGVDFTREVSYELLGPVGEEGEQDNGEEEDD